MTDEKPLPFNVVKCSSEEEGFECTALQNYREDGDGWLSERNCTYPQVLVLKLHNQNDGSAIASLEILCHDFCISQTIEIAIGYGSIDGKPPNSFGECESIQKLGYVTMDSNERSEFRDRELKSVPIGKPADFIKLVLHHNYENKYNEYSQVGLVGLRVFAGAVIAKDAPMPVAIEEAAPVLEDDAATSESEDKPKQEPGLNIVLPSPLPKALPPKIKLELEPKIQQSVDRLEKLKKERAALEVRCLARLLFVNSIPTFTHM